jgi:hypothetical protein
MAAFYVIQDPQGLLDRRRELERARQITQDASDSLGRMLAHWSWRGFVADRVKAAINEERLRLREAIGRIDAAITAIDRHRVWCEQQRTELSRLERRIRAWVQAFKALPPEAQMASRVKPTQLGILPRPHNTQWFAHASLLRRNAVSF